MSLVTAFLYFDTIPTTHYMLRARVVEDVEEYLYNMLRRHGSIQHPKLSYVIFVQRVDGHASRDLSMAGDLQRRRQPPR